MTMRFATNGMSLPPPRLDAASAPSPVTTGVALWGALVTASVALLLLALVASDSIRVAASALGLTGLLIVRIAAMYGGWLPRRGVRLAAGTRRILPLSHDREGIGMRGHDRRDRAANELLAVAPAAPRGERERPLDRVHDESNDSFPASDPPSWTGMRVGPPGVD